ncbi:MAG: phosphatidate cytidylyltransferase [Acidobacteria bacterium]|nr:phosphatidate cytidylyltransferase [Acidobacteriota bacterium]
MWKRILSALVLIPAVLAIMVWAPLWLFTLVVYLICLLAFHEFIRMGRNIFTGYRFGPVYIPAVLAGGVAIYPWIADHRLMALLAFFLMAGVTSVLLASCVEEIMTLLAWPLLGFVYIYILFSYVVDIRFSFAPEKGLLLLLFFLLIQWVGDTFSYLTGMAFGQHRLAPAISPKKTLEGTIGGLAGSASVGWLLTVVVLTDASPWLGLLFGLLVGGFGQLGDLLESQLKRTCKVKDSSNLIPGHGGVLDRLDSLIFTAPLYFGVLKYWLI